MMLIDTHCHLNDERLLPLVDDIVGDFAKFNLESAICVGYDLQSSICAVELASKYEKVYAVVGIHPHDSKYLDDASCDKLKELCKNDKVVAVGEIGLDYYYDLSPREVQQQAFQRQIELAAEVGLPVVLHVRDAYEDTRKILFDNVHLLSNGLLLHCYSGSAEMVRVFEKLDCYFAFGGAITFKNAKHNLEALKAVKLDRLMFETDCPYMTPVPFRGKTNEPKHVNLVVDKASEVLDVERDKLVEMSTTNAKRLFTRLK